jgi:hypothetical protein
VSFPAGFTEHVKVLTLMVAPGVPLLLADDFSTGASFTYRTPAIPNTSLVVEANANGPSGEYCGVQKTGLTANASGVALSSPPVPTLTVPVDEATGVNVTTPFAWTAYAGGVHSLFAHPRIGPSFLIFTAATMATIPDLASLGLSLPASTEYAWQVTGLAPVGSVDALAGPGGVAQVLAGDSTQGLSVTRTFTTPP